MHGKHSRVMFIPLYRMLVCNNGIDSRKCATGSAENPGLWKIQLIQLVRKNGLDYLARLLAMRSLPNATHWEVTPHSGASVCWIQTPRGSLLQVTAHRIYGLTCQK